MSQDNILELMQTLDDAWNSINSRRSNSVRLIYKTAPGDKFDLVN